ncbi:hypothetical protein CJJ23_03755 [Mycoplasmopsis agassizii]|uniref:Lipoprotein associated domain-containing protein n=1 Tax=Mycoplasmopsis agassizii TaxID=33922 RepID=A0A269TI65_9BACT|nr:hypothetical protein [Mycoplasmopsis agassizii]PAK21087.1 hypothetical protein CJJ23_03755 [Mycoplasmopsis agassizii]
MRKKFKKNIWLILASLGAVSVVATTIACTQTPGGDTKTPEDPPKTADEKELEEVKTALGAKSWGLTGKTAFAKTFKQLETEFSSYKSEVKATDQDMVKKLLSDNFGKEFTNALKTVTLTKVTLESSGKTTATMKLILKKSDATLSNVEAKLINLKAPQTSLEKIKENLEKEVFALRYLVQGQNGNLIDIPNPELNLASEQIEIFKQVLKSPTEQGGGEAFSDYLALGLPTKFKSEIKTAKLVNVTFEADDDKGIITISATLKDTGQTSVPVTIKISNLAKTASLDDLKKLVKLLENKSFEAPKPRQFAAPTPEFPRKFNIQNVSTLSDFKTYFESLKNHNLLLLKELIDEPEAKSTSSVAYKELVKFLNVFELSPKTFVSAKQVSDEQSKSTTITLTLKTSKDAPDSEMLTASFKLVNFDDVEKVKKLDDTIKKLEAKDWQVDASVETQKNDRQRQLSFVRYNLSAKLADITSGESKKTIADVFKELLVAEFDTLLENLEVVTLDNNFNNRDLTTWTIGLLVTYPDLKTTKLAKINITNLTKDVDTTSEVELKKVTDKINGQHVISKLAKAEGNRPKSTAAQAASFLNQGFERRQLQLISLIFFADLDQTTSTITKEQLKDYNDALVSLLVQPSVGFKTFKATAKGKTVEMKFTIHGAPKNGKPGITSEELTVTYEGFES